MTKTVRAHFTISGEFITEQSRSLWAEEGEPEKALRLLQGVRGLSTSQVLDILEGRSKLIGDSPTGVNLAPDNQKLPTLQETLRRLKKERDEALEDRADLLQFMNGDTVNVPSPTGLRTVPRRQTKRGKHGPVLRDGLDWEGVEGRNPSDVEPRIYQEVSRDAQDEAEEEVEEEYEKPKRNPPSGSKRITNDTGWLSPEGLFYSCRYGQHNDTAWHLGLDPWDMDKAGWVRLTVANGEQCFFRSDYDSFTKQQTQRILDYCTEKNIEKPWWTEFKDKRKVKK